MKIDVNRELTNDEIHMIDKCCDNNNSTTDSIEITDIRYTEQGNFTICNVFGLDCVYTGVAKRNNYDYNCKTAGYNISFMRALRSIVNGKGLSVGTIG